MPGWLDRNELRIGLGCMRLPIDEAAAGATVAAAVAEGVTVFDTAHAYTPDPARPGANERLLARALRACGATGARIVTKGGMTRPGGGWRPDGRARAVRADCEASLEALDGLAIDLFLLHAPDPRTPWTTSVRALNRLRDAGLVPRVGVSNVTRDQLEQALALAPITAVQVALHPGDDRAVRGGLLARCAELGITVIAHSPLGGPRRAPALARRAELVSVAAAHDATPAQVALAWVLGLSPAVVAIPGATREQSAASAARAGRLALGDGEHDRLTAAFSGTRAPVARSGAGEVALVMGIPGAGKTRLAEDHAARGYVRLNRDERGGGLRELAEALESELAAGHRHVVLDNTYLTRAARSYVVDAAARHGVPVRCVWCRTPLAQAQVNLVLRLLEPDGALPGPEALRGRAPGVMAPTSQMRALRELEEPAADEGFAAVEVVDFARLPGDGRPGVLVAAAALEAPGWEGRLRALAPDAPHLVFDWRPGGGADVLAAQTTRLAEVVSGPVTGEVCPHGGGAPSCWCRPPLPGLALAFARRHGVELSRASLVGVSTAHRTLAATLGARFIAVVA